jgi:hypothetical protein
MCTCITFNWTRQLFNTSFTGPVALGGRELFVLVLHSAGPDSYLALRSPAQCNTSTHNYRPPNTDGTNESNVK